MQAGDILPLYGARMVAPALVTGALYDAGEYPAAVQVDAGGQIVGELWELPDPAIFQPLDEYEEYQEGDPDSLFVRELVTPTRLDNGKKEPAWAYFYTNPVHGLSRIELGDYRKVIARR